MEQRVGPREIGVGPGANIGQQKLQHKKQDQGQTQDSEWEKERLQQKYQDQEHTQKREWVQKRLQQKSGTRSNHRIGIRTKTIQQKKQDPEQTQYNIKKLKKRICRRSSSRSIQDQKQEAGAVTLMKYEQISVNMTRVSVKEQRKVKPQFALMIVPRGLAAGGDTVNKDQVVL